MRVYHFLCAKYAISNLQKKEMKISTFGDLNDPFEFLNCEMANKDFQDAINKTRAEIYNYCGVICFSKNWSNPLLWSHYADKHKGICLGFDVRDDKLDQLVKMDYINNKKELCYELEKEVGQNQRNDEAEEIIMKKLLVSKFKDWEYEDEVRMFAQLDEKDKDNHGKYFVDTSNILDLKQVIIGVRCDKTIEDIKICVEGYTGIEVIKARLDFETFKVF